MADLQELMRQKAELERLISHAQSQSRADAIAQIRKLMDENGLTATDLVAPTKRASASRSATTLKRHVAAKYKDTAGNQWSGRGLKPKWLTQALKDGKRLEDFAI